MSFYTSCHVLGNSILYRGIENNKRIYRKINYQPSLFLPSEKPTKFTTIDGKYADKIKFESIKEARNFISKYEGIENFTYYGNSRYNYVYLSEEFPEQIDYNIDDLRIFNLDIETSSLNGFPDYNNPIEKITAITIQVKDKFYVFSYKEFKSDDKKIIYSRYDSEIELLEAFVKFWSRDYPDIITGWNIYGFDIPYLYARISKILGKDFANKLSPYSWCKESKKFFKNMEKIGIDILGVESLDYMELYVKFQPKQERTSLNYISYIELGEEKLDYEEHGTLDALYINDFDKFIKYNVKDVELVSKLEDKLKLIDLSVALAFDSKSNFGDVLSQIRMWDNIIFSYLRKKNIVVPKISIGEKKEKYKGAYVRDVIPGMYNNVVSFDFASLYPNLMIEFNISPETLVKNKFYDLDIDKLLNREIDLVPFHSNENSISASGYLFKKEKRGIIPEILITMYEDRKKYKKLMLDAENELEEVKKLPRTEENKIKLKKLKNDVSKYGNFQLTKKVCLNSCYGAFGNGYFRYFDVRIAEAVTLSGQVVTQWLIKDMNKFCNSICNTEDVDYCIYSDTDSCYFRFDDVVKSNGLKDKKEIVDFLDKFSATELKPVIEKSAIEFKNYFNAYEHRMQMKREVIADRGVWAAKKKYILNIYDSEGVRYTQPKIKISGLEAIKSSTPEICREKLKESIKIILEGTQEDLWKLVSDFKKNYKNYTIGDIAFPRKIGDFSKYEDKKNIFIKGTQFHFRGVLWYNHLLRKHGLVKKYRIIEARDEIKFFYIFKNNNITNDYTFAITNAGLPPELGIDKFIDYDTQFQKSFIDSLNLIIEKIGWTPEKVNTLGDLF